VIFLCSQVIFHRESMQISSKDRHLKAIFICEADQRRVAASNTVGYGEIFPVEIDEMIRIAASGYLSSHTEKNRPEDMVDSAIVCAF